MRRPSVIFLLALTMGILLACHELFGTIFIGLILVLTLIFDYKNSKMAVCLLGAILGFGLLSFNEFKIESCSNQYTTGKTIEISGYFYQNDFLDEKNIWLKTHEGTLFRLKFNPYKPHTAVESGSMVTIKGNYRSPSPARNPKGFDEKKWLFSKGATGTIDIQNIKIQKRSDPIERVRCLIGMPLVHGILQNTAFKQGPMAAGMLLGEDSWIPKEILDAYTASGTNHILSVSGAHFGVLLYWLYRLMGKREISYYVKKLGIWAILGGFIWLIGADTAAVRAYLMFLLFDLARWSNKQTDPLNCLCLTAGTMLIINPFAIWDIGLQLAFSAMYGLVVLAPFMRKCFLGSSDLTAKKLTLKREWLQLGADEHRLRFKVFLKIQLLKLIDAMLLSLCACICLYPILRSQFNAFSWWSIVYNIPVSLLSAVYLPLGVLEGILSPFPFLARGVGVLSGSVVGVMSMVVKTSLALPKSKALTSLSTTQTMFYYAALLLPLYFKQVVTGVTLVGKPRENRRVLCCSVGFMATILFITVCILPKYHFDKRLEIYYLDVGQGDASVIVSPDGQVIVIDAGLESGNRQVADSLLKLGIDEVDWLIVSHPHSDHIGGAEKILSTLRVKRFAYFNGHYNNSETQQLKKLEGVTKLRGGEVVFLEKGDLINVSAQLKGDVLHPQKGFDSESANDESLVIQFDYKDTNFLFTGDISDKVDCDIIEQVKNDKTVIKIPHHGSATSSGESLVGLKQLEMGVIQVGEKNRYGHPKPDVLARYAKQQVPLLRNDLNGCIQLSSDGKQFWYRVQIQEEDINVIYQTREGH